MTDEEKSRVHAAAAAMRRAFETINLKKYFADHGDFPTGYCLDASRMLGEYLFEDGLGEYTIICGKREKTHAWLEGHGLTIDITPDQFDDMAKRFIVTDCPSEWHGGFTVIPEWCGPARLEKVDCRSFYDLIKNKTEELLQLPATV